jgi:hypothetical protein
MILFFIVVRKSWAKIDESAGLSPLFKPYDYLEQEKEKDPDEDREQLLLIVFDYIVASP